MRILVTLITVGAGSTAFATSEGHYARGTLVLGTELPEEGPDHYLVVPRRCYDRSPLREHYKKEERTDNFYGHPSVVQAIRHVAADLRQADPSIRRMPVGEISNRRGGKIPFHLSHQNGLDVDIPYLSNQRIPPCHDGPRYEFYDGHAWRVRGAFDEAKNWAMVSRFAARSDVRQIFVGGLIRKSLLAWAKENVSAKERRRTAKKLIATFCRAPKGAMMGTYKNNRCPHDDHIHVRFRCPKDSKKCRETKKR